MYGTELVIFNSIHNTERLIVSIIHHYADSVIAEFAIPTLYSKNLKMFLARYRLIFLRTNATRVHKSNFVLSVRGFQYVRSTIPAVKLECTWKRKVLEG